MAGMLTMADQAPLTNLRLSYKIKLKIDKLTYKRNLAVPQSHSLSHLLIGKTCIKLFLRVIVNTGTAATFNIG